MRQQHAVDRILQELFSDANAAWWMLAILMAVNLVFLPAIYVELRKRGGE